jgi:hypothetical protein
VSVTSEIHDAAEAIHALPAHDPYDEAVAALLDQVALTTPVSVVESQAGVIVRLSLAIARARKDPAGLGRLADETAARRTALAVAVGAPVQGVDGAPTQTTLRHGGAS